MPVYTYQCKNCKTQMDLRESFNSPPTTTCPECGEGALHRVYKPVRVIFKGSGFYATDNRSPSGLTDAKPEKNEKSDDSNSSKKSTDATSKKSDSTSKATTTEKA